MLSIRIGRLKINVTQLIHIVLLISSFGGFIISWFHCNNTLYYVADFINCFLLVCIFIYKKRIDFAEKKKLRTMLFLFTINILLGVLLNGVAIGLAAWGVRNYLRFIVYFYACIVFLNEKEVLNLLEKLPVIYYINFAFCIFELLLGYEKDYLGGIFGISQGCNGAIVIFLNICLAIFIARFLNKKINVTSFLVNIFIYFCITIMAELKCNYLFFVLIILSTVLLNKDKIKSLMLLIVSFLVLYVGINALLKYSPGSAAVLTNLDKMSDYLLEGFHGTTVFTRSTSIMVTNEMFFRGNTLLYILGFGTGACDTSAYFSSAFYTRYGYMNYRQYSVPMMLLQNGYWGLILLFLFLISSGTLAFKTYKKKLTKYNWVFLSIVSIALFGVIDCFNATIFIDAGYWLFYFLAIPFVMSKKECS